MFFSGAFCPDQSPDVSEPPRGHSGAGIWHSVQEGETSADAVRGRRDSGGLCGIQAAGREEKASGGDGRACTVVACSQFSDA